MKKTLILSILLLAFGSVAQNEAAMPNPYPAKSTLRELTLDTSVTEQYRSFYPSLTTNFQFLPGSDYYSVFSERWDKVEVFNNYDQLEHSVNLAELNDKLGTRLNYLSGFEWKNDKEFYISSATTVYSFNIIEKTGQKLFDLEQDASTGSFNAHNAYVYLKDNNIHLQTGKGRKEVTKFDDKNIVSGQAIARSEFGITNGIFWSPKGNKIGFYQKDETNVHDYPLLDITKTPGELKSIKYPMAGQKSEKPRIGIITVKNGKAKYLSTYGTEEDHYLTNFGWGPNEEFAYIAEVNRDQNHMKLLKYDAKSGKLVKVLFEEKNDKWVEPEHPVFFLPETPNQFVWMSERDGFMNLYLYDTEGNLIKQLTKNKWVAQEILGVNSTGEYLIFQGTGENPLNTMIFKVNLKTGKQTLITKTEGTHHCELSGNGKVLFDSYSNHNTPLVQQILDLEGNEGKKFGEVSNPLSEYKIGTADISSIKAADGTILHTRMIKPKNFNKNKKYPVLVYVYGGPHAQMVTNSWLDGASLWMYWMAEQGYVIYTVDNRGSGNRGFAFESVIHRDLGKYEMEDQLAGVDYLKSLPFVDSKRIAVHGWSFGGYMTTSLMLKHPGIYTTGVAGGPVTDWSYYEAMYGERYMDRPEQNVEGYKNTNLSNHVSNLEGNLLLIHGLIDDVVVPQHNYKLVKSFVDKGVQVDFFPYPNHKHNVRGKDRVHLIEKVLHYVIEHNK
jgi:dipeptidyl-peptidase-4